jgi:hypothetical protein
MTCSTRSRVASATSSTPRTTFDTVDLETPAAAATSRIVGFFPGRRVPRDAGLLSPLLTVANLRVRTQPPARLAYAATRASAELPTARSACIPASPAQGS